MALARERTHTAMRIATYNINGMNARKPVLLRWLEQSRPDLVCLQELKSPQERFPQDEHKYLIHDRDRIFAKHLDDSIRALGLAILRSPFASPKANAICERVIGTIRRECLDWMIPMSEAHLRSILKAWVTHYNGARPHNALGPGVPDPPPRLQRIARQESRHRLPAAALVLANRCWAACITSIRLRRLRRTRSGCSEARRTAGRREKNAEISRGSTG